MTEKNLYMLFQMAGFLLQMLPVICLVFAPFGDDQMKLPRRKAIGIFVGIALVFSVEGALFLGSVFQEKSQNFSNIAGNLIFFVALMLGTVIYFLNMKKETEGRLLCYMMALQYGMFMYTVAEIVTDITNALHIYFITGWSPYGTQAVICYLATFLLTYPFVHYFFKRYSFKNLKRVSKKNIAVISGCSIVLVLLYFTALLLEMKLRRLTETGDVLLAAWLVCLMISDVLAYGVYFICLDIENKNAEMNIQLTASEIQYKSMCDKISEEKRSHHNIRHHFRSMLTWVHNRQYDELEMYLRRYLDEWDKISSVNISRNTMINNILEYYFTKAENENIQLDYEIDLKEYYPFNIMDLTILLGNMMENAIEACMRQNEGKKEIRLMMKQHKQTILIEESNTYDVDEARNREKEIRAQTYSAKRGGSGGYGMSSMRMIAEKYGGSVDFFARDNLFTIRIVLNIPGEGSLLSPLRTNKK